MIMMTERPAEGANQALWSSTIALTVCFAVWTIFSIVGLGVKDQLGLSETQFGLLIGTPILTGSLTRVRRTCLTQREWDRLAEVTRRGVEGLERDANQSEGLRNNSFRGPGG